MQTNAESSDILTLLAFSNIAIIFYIIQVQKDTPIAMVLYLIKILMHKVF